MEKKLQVPANFDDELPFISESYMEMLFDHGKEREQKDIQYLLEYISNMEKQFDEVLTELHDVKHLLNTMQGPSVKSRLSNVVDQTQNIIMDGKNKLSQLKTDILSSMKHCVEEFKKSGKSVAIKTINVLHFKEALTGIQKTLYKALNKTSELIRTMDMLTVEIRSMKRSFKNIGLLLLGKPINHNTQDIQKLNMMQKCSRSMLNGLKSMTRKTTKVLHRLYDMERGSVKKELKLLSNQINTPDEKKHKKDEQIR